MSNALKDKIYYFPAIALVVYTIGFVFLSLHSNGVLFSPGGKDFISQNTETGATIFLILCAALFIFFIFTKKQNARGQ